MKIAFAFLALTIAGNFSYGKAQLNSSCYLEAKSGAQIQGENSQNLFEIASVSKIFTSLWALQTLGAQYRYETKIYLTPVSKDTYDVHIQGSNDPYFGRQLTHFLFSELNRHNVKRIAHLSFDENFKTRWNVLTDFIETTNPSAAEIAASFETHVKKLVTEYPATVREALRSRIVLPSRLSLSLGNVSFVDSHQFVPKATTRAFVMKSSPLFRYLKAMNRTSNNHVADKIYDFLGGNDPFQNFISRTVGLHSAQVQFVNGSGNSIVTGTLPDGTQQKAYNKANCESLIRTIVALEQSVRNQGLELKDILAVSRSDDSTLNPRYDGMPDTIVAKTGTVDPAIALAGMASTGRGEIYFGYLYGTNGMSDRNEAKDQIRNRVFELVQNFGGGHSFAYSPVEFLSFDDKSYFTPVNVPALRQP